MKMNHRSIHCFEQVFTIGACFSLSFEIPMREIILQRVSLVKEQPEQQIQSSRLISILCSHDGLLFSCIPFLPWPGWHIHPRVSLAEAFCQHQVPVAKIEVQIVSIIKFHLCINLLLLND
jgi:hypothetical protein